MKEKLYYNLDIKCNYKKIRNSVKIFNQKYQNIVIPYEEVRPKMVI